MASQLDMANLSTMKLSLAAGKQSRLHDVDPPTINTIGLHDTSFFIVSDAGPYQDDWSRRNFLIRGRLAVASERFRSRRRVSDLGTSRRASGGYIDGDTASF